MVRRHPFPKVWLLSDERLAVRMTELAAMLPPGSGIVLRHDSLKPGARWRLLRRLARTARTRNLMLLLAGSPALAKRWGADGVHLRQHHVGQAERAHRTGLIVTMPVHTRQEARAAKWAEADGAFISPLYPTRSHPGASAIGRAVWLRLARLVGAEPIALGGMSPARARQLRRSSGLDSGWAAIDAWEEKATRRRMRQKRNAVPT